MSAVLRAFAEWQEQVRRNQARLAALRESDDDTPAVRSPSPRRAPETRFAFGSAQPGAGFGGVADARAGMAAGAQAAVVKIVSFAGGRARVGALLAYQSREGTLELEREDGSLIQGTEALKGLADAWNDEEDRRKPSNDVLYFTVSAASDVSREAIEAGLGEAMAGHKYAWRAEREGGGLQLHVVASAASAVRNERGQAQRLFDNNKSMNGLHDRLEGAFDGALGFEERGWAHGVDGAARLLCRLTRDGQTPAVASSGKQIASHEAHWEIANAWKPSLRSREQRDVAHIILSAKPGTDKDAFVDGARAMLAKEFSGHDYAFALHADRAHLHVHAVVRTLGSDGQRLHPGVGDLRRWRQTMAQEARARDIPMEAASRFEQAHAPAYKLRDVRMIERGNAPEHVRKRVEAVKTKAIHVPTRPEGRERARRAAEGWRALSEAPPFGPEPPRAAQTMRLYRAESMSRSPAHGGREGRLLFTTDRGEAERLAARQGQSALAYLDIPDSARAQLAPSRERPESTFLVAEELAAMRRPIPKIAEADILPFRERVETAHARSERRHERRAPPPTDDRREDKIATVAPKSVPPSVAIAEQKAVALAGIEAAMPALSLEDRRALAMAWKTIAADYDAKIAAARDRESAQSQVAVEADAAAAAAARHPPFGAPAPPETQRQPTKETIMANIARARQVAQEEMDHLDRAAQAAPAAFRAEIAAVQERLRASTARLIEVAENAEANRARMTEVRRETPRDAVLPESSEGAGAAGSNSTEPSPPPATIARTPSERQLALEEIRARVEAEARKETRQANIAGAIGENNIATGDAAHPYRSQSEARAAREAARAEDNNPDRPMPADPSQSQAIQQARFEQEKLLAEQAEQQRIQRRAIEERLDQIANERKAREAKIYGQDYEQEM